MNNVSSMTSRQSLRLVEWALFLFVWLVFGLGINSANLDAFNLQQAGVESLVERHQVSLEGSAAPQLQIKVYYDGDRPFGDTFMYNGRQYAAKQPGQFMLGAIVFFVLRLFGLSYVNHYTLTSALVTFFTASLATAVAAIAVFRTVQLLTSHESIIWPLTGALLFAFGTTAFVYSGIAYHDAIASSYLAVAFYLAALLAHAKVARKRFTLITAVAGFFLGLTVTTSMLPFFMACVLGVYLIWITGWQRAFAVILGGFAGITPLFVYNAKAFANPLLNSYTAGGYPESFLHLNLYNFIAKTQLYVSEITLYDPLVWLGIAGLVFFPAAFRRERLVIAALLIVHAFQVLNIESHGGCHYGPRFLLPIMPFTAIGLSGFYFLRTTTTRRLSAIGIALVGLASVAINAVGAFSGAMYCEVQLYALWPALNLLRNGSQTFPLARWLIVPVLASVVLLVYAVHRSTNTAQAV
jgi:hypothetical protein